MSFNYEGFGLYTYLHLVVQVRPRPEAHVNQALLAGAVGEGPKPALGLRLLGLGPRA